MSQRKPIRAATARGETAAEAPKFQVAPRMDRIRNYPCTKCHDNKFVDRRVRELQDEHTKLVFEHGGGRFWCYDACHKGTDMDNLVSLRGRRVSYDESYKVCGQCHFQRLDWYFGGHGKRQGAWENQREIPRVADELKVEDRSQIGRWGGERVILNCTECHDAHSPSIKPFEPSPPPKVRSGLRQPAVKSEPEPKIWERLAEPEREALMPKPRTAPGDAPDVSRRDFLTKRLPGRIAGLLGGGAAAAAPSLPTAEAGRPDSAGSFSPRDLTPMTP